MALVADHRRPVWATLFMLGETIKAADKFRPGVLL
jgi:hypothetical protein